MPFTHRYLLGPVLVAGFVTGACDRFWTLSVSAITPLPVPTECVQATLSQLDGAESVWVHRYPPDTGRSESTVVAIWSERRYGRLIVTPSDSAADSLRLMMSDSWVGQRPNRDSVEARAGMYSDVIRRVARACWGTDPRVTVELPR